MRRVYLFLLTFGCKSVAYGQHMEYSVLLNSGLSRFGGESSATTTTMFINDTWGSAPTVINPYGSRYNLSLGSSLQLQYVTATGFLLGSFKKEFCLTISPQV